MAPKGTKRPAQGTKASHPSKVPKRDSRIEAVLEIVEKAEGLPEDCASMLCEMIPRSLNTAADSRHAIQKLTVGMVGELVETITSTMREAIQMEEKTCADVEAEKKKLEAAATEAENDLASMKAVTDAQQAALAEAETAAREKNSVLVAAQVAQAKADSDLATARKDKDLYEAVLENNVKALSTQDLEPANAQTHLDALLPLVKNLVLDDSLRTALPTTCLKTRSARGVFDQMVLQELEKVISEHLVGLASTVNNNTSVATERVAACEEAQRVLNAANEIKQGAATELADAKTTQKDAVNLLSARRTDLANFQPTYENATKARDEKKQVLKQFEDVNVACFTELRDKVSVQPQPVIETVAKEAPEVVSSVCVEAAGA
jgi:hypothetical protein